MKHYSIIGCGALGLYVGGQLLQAGVHVNFVARSNYDVLKHSGFTLTIQQQQHLLKPDFIFNDVAQLPQADVVIITTLTSENQKLAPLLNNALTPNGIVISLQNGIDYEVAITQAINPHKLLSGACWIRAEKRDNEVTHRFGSLIQLAEYGNTQQTHEAKFIQHDFQKAGMDLQLSNDAHRLQWTKLALSLPFFLLMVKYNIERQTVFQRHLEEVTTLQNEIFRLAKKLGHTIDHLYIQQTMSHLKGLPSQTLSAQEKLRLTQENESALNAIRRVMKAHNIESVIF